MAVRCLFGIHKPRGQVLESTPNKAGQTKKIRIKLCVYCGKRL